MILQLMVSYIVRFLHSNPDDQTPIGLISSHAYSILQALEYNGKRFLKIRNPWGRGEWNGRWSDGSKEWTKEWLPALDLLNHQFGDDGSFIMEYEDFLRTWYAVERTQLFDESWIQSSHWLNVTSRTFPCPWQFGDVSCEFFYSDLELYSNKFPRSQSHSPSLRHLQRSLFFRKLIHATGPSFPVTRSGHSILFYTKKEVTRSSGVPNTRSSGLVVSHLRKTSRLAITSYTCVHLPIFC